MGGKELVLYGDNSCSQFLCCEAVWGWRARRFLWLQEVLAAPALADVHHGQLLPPKPPRAPPAHTHHTPALGDQELRPGG